MRVSEAATKKKTEKGEKKEMRDKGKRLGTFVRQALARAYVSSRAMRKSERRSSTQRDLIVFWEV